MSRAVAAFWSNVEIVQQNLEWFCGDDVVVTFNCQDFPPNINAWTVAAYLRKSPGITQPIILTWPANTSGLAGQDGQFTISPASADTLDLTPGVFDLEVSQINGGAYTVLTRVQLTLFPR
jgi:hypothetical protein